MYICTFGVNYQDYCNDNYTQHMPPSTEFDDFFSSTIMLAFAASGEIILVGVVNQSVMPISQKFFDQAVSGQLVTTRTPLFMLTTTLAVTLFLRTGTIRIILFPSYCLQLHLLFAGMLRIWKMKGIDYR